MIIRNHSSQFLLVLMLGCWSQMYHFRFSSNWSHLLLLVSGGHFKRWQFVFESNRWRVIQHPICADQAGQVAADNRGEVLERRSCGLVVETPWRHETVVTMTVLRHREHWFVNTFIIIIIMIIIRNKARWVRLLTINSFLHYDDEPPAVGIITKSRDTTHAEPRQHHLWFNF